MKHIITILLILLANTGCAPYLTYEEMEDAYEIAETKEEKDALNKKIVAFEENWEKAIIYFEKKSECHAHSEYTWYCDDIHSIEERRIRNVDALVRIYKKERHNCFCVNTNKMINTLNRGY